LHSFGRIWTFQWVTANPNKKISSHLNSRARLRSERLKECAASAAPRAIAKPRRINLAKISVARDSGFSKKMPTGRRLKTRSHIWAVWALEQATFGSNRDRHCERKRGNPGERRARTFSGLLRCCAPRNDNSILPSRENLETGRDQTPSPSVPVGGLIQLYFSAFPIRFSTVSRNKMLVDL
jgi:hypothetical protein